MGERRKAREWALQAVYLTDLTATNVEQALRGVVYGQKAEAKTLRFAEKLAIGVIQNRPKLDEMILSYTENWELKRMAALDRNILRLGAYEMLFEIDTPVSVIIDEAVEIAKIYSTEESGKFVNGILDKIKAARPANSPSDGNETKP